MNAAERLAMIRARLQKPALAIPRPVGLNRAANPDAPMPVVRKPYVRFLNPSNHNWHVGGEYCPTSDNRPPWVYQPDKSKRIQCAQKRTARKHHLTQIAEKWLHAPKLRAKVTL